MLNLDWPRSPMWRRVIRRLAVRVVSFGLLYALPVTLVATNAQPHQRHIVLVHGMWAKPESLSELGSRLQQRSFSIHFIDYKSPERCEALGAEIRESLTRIAEQNHISADQLFIVGYSLGAMGVALAEFPAAGIILDAPANYPTEACNKLPDYFPGSDKYDLSVLRWRNVSDNKSPAVEAFMRTRSRVLVIGHIDDRLVPQQTVMAFAHASKASIWWVPGDHTPDWRAVANIVNNFVREGEPTSVSVDSPSKH